MKRLGLFIIGILFACGLSAQTKNDFRYVINSYGGITLGGTWSTKTANTVKLTNWTLDGNLIKVYDGATQRSFAVAPADQIDGSTVYAAKYLTDTTSLTSATYSLVAADAGRVIYCSHATFQEITIPANATTSIPVGTIITFVRTGAGQVRLTPAANVIRNSVLDSTTMGTRYQTYQIIKRATNKWQFVGNFVD